MKIIECDTCGEPCGKQYPDTHEEPGFREGKGENFRIDGLWFCSQKCMDFCISECVSAENEDRERGLSLCRALEIAANEAAQFESESWE